MKASTRIIVNTAAQYVKSIVNILLALYSTRLVLAELNVNDYGIYSVVGGVVGILGYLTNSLIITTQRYLSYYQGAGDKYNAKLYFTNSLLIHIAFGILFCILLFAFEDLLFSHLLSIDTHRLEAAHFVYKATVLMMFTTVITAPFKALFISHENIVYISIVEVADGVLKLLLALSLIIIGFDKLEFYAFGMTIILVINLTAYIVYALLKYDESHIEFKRESINKRCIYQLLGFAGWTTFGMVAGMCQTQGLSIVLNNFFGTAINAAYGIANQVNGAVKFISSSILNAMNPQIMKAEGNGDRRKMLELASKESKFSTALVLLISIPILIEMNGILSFWLKEVPNETSVFCRAMILAFLADQTTMGLHAANQATGKIGLYSIIMYTPKILIVFIAWLALYKGSTVTLVMGIYVAIELLVAIARLPYMKVTTGLHIINYIKSVLIPLIPIIVCEAIAGFAICYLLNIKFRFLITFTLCCIVGVVALFAFTLSKSERNYITNLVTSKIRK